MRLSYILLVILFIHILPQVFKRVISIVCLLLSSRRLDERPLDETLRHGGAAATMQVVLHSGGGSVSNRESCACFSFKRIE